jgi:hypothetical protein
MRRLIPGLIALAMFASEARCYADISSGLIAYYPFNGSAADGSGSGNDGSVLGASLIQDRFGKANSAYGFDGTDDYVRIADSQSLNLTGDLTISAWIRTTTLYSIIFSNMLETSPHSGYSLRLTSSGALDFSSGDKILIGQTSVNTGTWKHVAVTLSGTTATSYINGALDISGTVGIPTSSSVDQTIGASYTPFYFWNGSLDDIRVYNRALSAPEVQQLFAAPEPSDFVLLSTGGVLLLGYARKIRTFRGRVAVN